MAKKYSSKTVNKKVKVVPPSKTFVRNFMLPFRFYFAPQFYGLKELDVSHPAMYVSNHTVLGLLDGYPFAAELYLQKNIFLRSLADSNHFMIPVWRDLIQESLGAVEASRENCRALMKGGESILVFPGGTREICKKRGEEYILKWSDRTGFVRMAMEYGYDIIPVAAVGAEEAYTIIEDANDFLKTPFGKFLDMIGVAEKYFKSGDLIPPVVRGIGETIIPRPVKLYFSFGERISTKRLKRKFDDVKTQTAVKKKVEQALLAQFKNLFEIRDADKDRSKWRRLLNLKKPHLFNSD